MSVAYSRRRYRAMLEKAVSVADRNALAKADPIWNFSMGVSLENKENKRVVLDGEDGVSTPNILQWRMRDAYMYFRLRGLPIRMMVLKCRKDGASTFSGYMCYHHSRSNGVGGMVIGDEAQRTESVWKIFTEWHKRDKFPWDSVIRFNTEKLRMRWKDGKEVLWEHDTANDPKAGIGGTRHVLWFTEAARYAKTGARTDANAITAAIQSLGSGENSMVIAESTADGAGSWFHRTWQAAVTLPDAIKGNVGNGWIRVFAAWYEFADRRLKREQRTEQYFELPLSAREKRGRDLYGWDDEQIAWRRFTILDQCDNNEGKFDENFPEDDVSCFLTSGRAKFCVDGVARLEKLARATKGEEGILQRSKDGKILWIPQEGGWLWVAKKPKHGCAYLAAADCMMGEQAEGARDPDAHAGLILCAPHFETGESGHIERNTEMSACINVRGGCRWDIDLFADRLAMLADWYGGAMVVPEANGPGAALILKLREAGARIYHREKFLDAFNPGKRLSVAGWHTDKQSRDVAVEALTTIIREQKLDCAYGPAIAEMRTFIENDRGKAEARSGSHDDWVMALGIGMACIKFASVYRETVQSVYVPGQYRPDTRRDAAQNVAFS